MLAITFKLINQNLEDFTYLRFAHIVGFFYGGGGGQREHVSTYVFNH
jgi:hypothetical protein